MNILTRQTHNVVIIEMNGKLDINSSLSIKECINRALMANRSKIIMNLAKVDFINSSGLGILVSGLKMIREASGSLKFSDLQPYVKELFEISQLTRVFSIYPTEEEALASFEQS